MPFVFKNLSGKVAVSSLALSIDAVEKRSLSDSELVIARIAKNVDVWGL